MSQNDVAVEWVSKLCEAAHNQGELSVVQRVAIADASIMLGAFMKTHPDLAADLIADCEARRRIDLSVGRITYESE